MRHNRQLWWGRAAITLLMGLAAWHLIPPAAFRHAGLGLYEIWAFSHWAYSDIFALYQRHQLANHALVYWRTPIEYPVLMGLSMWLAAWMPFGAVGFFAGTAAALWAAALLAHYALWRRNPALARAFAFSPLLLVYGLLNWDIGGIALMMGAMALYRRERWTAAGITWAAAVFFKLFPVFYLPFLAVDLWQRRRRRALWRLTRAFVLAAVAMNAPAAIANWSNWSLFFSFNATRGAGADIWNNALWHLTSVAWADCLSLVIVMAAMVLGIVWMRRGGTWEQASALAFAVFLFVNKVFSPQYMLWLWAFGAVADWPIASLAALSAAGVADYVNSMAILHLVRSGSAAVAQWYARVIFPAGLGVRYGAILGGTVGALLKALLRPPSGPQASPPPGSETLSHLPSGR
jgi:hypothetical protein